VKILIPQSYNEHHDQYLAQYKRTNKTHIIGTGRELVAKRKDGTTFPIHLSVSEIPNHEEKMYVELIRDITQQRVLEDEASSHIEQMAHADRLNALGEMAAGIAHEINQPLTAISLFSQTAKNFCEIGKFERLPELFDKISQQSLRAGSVLERVQMMTRQGDRSKEVIDSNILIDEVKKLAESEARLRDINIQLLPCHQKKNVFVDRVQIQQVILNLLRNGMEAMQSIDCRNGAIIKLQIKLQIKVKADNCIEILVIDTGCGIPNSMIDNLFTPFSTTKKNGTGIGLSISKSIVEEHGGHIHFSENKPAGAIFYFTLPIHEEGIPNDK
jgi:two-component system sensor kinase FixL